METTAGASALEIAKSDLLALGIIIACGLVGAVIAKKFKIPDIIFYLLIGVGIGPVGLGWVHIGADTYLNQMILTVGAAFLLFDGGASLRFSVLKNVWVTILIISTLGVIITGAVVTGIGVWVGLPLMAAMLLGATIASTDPATLVPIFKQIPIQDKVAQTVMSESAFNDAMGAIATFTVMGIALGTTTFNAGQVGLQLVWQAGVGTAIGVVLGLLVSLLISHPRLGVMNQFKRLLTILAILMAFLAADLVHASGFMAVFCFGVMMGNRGSFKSSMSHHDEEIMEDFIYLGSVMMRLLIFVLLGTQVNFALIAQYWQAGLLIVAVFIFVARPVTVFLCAGPDRKARWTFKELVFLSWTRETGVIPAALAGMMIGLKVPHAEIVASITFMAILVTILLQGLTTKWVASKLGVLKT